MEIEDERNAPVIAFLKANAGKKEGRREALQRPWQRLGDWAFGRDREMDSPPPEVVTEGFQNIHGTHPEVVERILQLSAGVPGCCRATVCGSPALVHPETGVILAFGAGTVYYLRLPPALAPQAVQAGALLRYKWSFGGEMDVRAELGDEWVGGRWLKPEPAWCAAAYDYFSGGAGGHRDGVTG